MNTRIDEQTGASRKSFADQKLVIIDNLANDLRVVREKVDDNNVRVGSLGQELDALRQSVTAPSVARPAAPPEGDSTANADPTAATSHRRRPLVPLPSVSLRRNSSTARSPTTTPVSMISRFSASSPT